LSKVTTVLVAGIGGGSLGVEIGKALRLAGRYVSIGCDISPLAFGHYCGVFDRTELVPLDGYLDALVDLCERFRIDVVIPGGDQPMTIIAAAGERFERLGARIAANGSDVVAMLSDKQRCFEELERRGFAIPRTIALVDETDAERAPLPCVVKPSTGSGGSAFVFFARTREEVALYAAYLRNNGKRAIAQEYVSTTGGEFTVGVISRRDGTVRASIALKRAFPAKLSIAASGQDFLISTGITQGHIGDYPEVARVATEIAAAVGSVGPMNVQGRIDGDGRFLPFEINPRFSASTYLRALAGFNEVEYFIEHLRGDESVPLEIRSGWYLRGVTETVVADGAILK